MRQLLATKDFNSITTVEISKTAGVNEALIYTLHWMKLRFGYSRYVYPIPVERDVMIGLKSAI